MEAMLREEEKFRQNKLLAERVLNAAPEPKEIYRSVSSLAVAQRPPQRIDTQAEPPQPKTIRPAQTADASAAADRAEALRQRVVSLEETNAMLNYRVSQLEGAVAVLARLVDHPLVQEALEGQVQPPVHQRQERGADDEETEDEQQAEADDADADGADNDIENDDDSSKDFKRLRQGKGEFIPPQKKKWYELVAMIKEMKPNNGYPIRSLIIAAIESAKADPLYAKSNIPERLEKSLDNYCRKSAGPTKRAALQVLDSVWQFVSEPLPHSAKKQRSE